MKKKIEDALYFYELDFMLAFNIAANKLNVDLTELWDMPICWQYMCQVTADGRRNHEYYYEAIVRRVVEDRKDMWVGKLF